MVAVMAITGLTLTGTSLLAQGLSAATTVQSTSVAAAPQLAYGVPQILQLVQARSGMTRSSLTSKVPVPVTG